MAVAVIDKLMRRLGYTRIQKRSLVQDVTFRDPTLRYKVPTTARDFIQVYKTHPWVHACISKTAKTIASVPLKLYRWNERGEAEEVGEHWLWDVLARVNTYTTIYDFKEQLVIDLETTGSFLAEIEFSTEEESRPVALHRMRPECVEIEPDPEVRVRAYKYTVNGRSVVLPAEKVLHLYYHNPDDPVFGLSPLSPLAITLIGDFYARAYNRRFFQNDASVPAVLETDAELSQDEVQLVREAWRAAHQGVDKAHSVAVLWGGLKYKEIGARPKDAAFLEFMKMAREEICAVLGVPPAVVGIFEYANYANAEAQIRIFWQDKIAPLCEKIQQMLTEQFIQRFEPDMFVRFDLSGVPALQEDQRQAAEIDERMVRNGLATINERRALRGLEPVPWGDTWYAPRIYVPVNALTEVAMGSGVMKQQADPETALLQRKQASFSRVYRKYITRLRRFFERQAERARERLERATGQGLRKGIDLLPPEEDGLLERELRGLWVLAATAAVEDLTDVFPALAYPNLEAVYAELAARVTRINDTTRAAIAEVMRKGFEEGRSVYEMWHGYKGFKGIRDVFAEASDYRAEMIARTETMLAYNKAAILTYQENGVRKVKVLDGQLPTSDDHCRARHGTIVTIEEAALMEDHPNGTLAFAPAEW